MVVIEIFKTAALNAGASPLSVAGITAGAALAGVFLTLLYNVFTSKIRRRQELEDARIKRAHELEDRKVRRANELEDSQRIRDSDFLYISTQLVLLLEDFAQSCAAVAEDGGVPAEVKAGQQMEIKPGVSLPELSFTGIDGNWKSLPPLIMFMTLELPVLLKDARTVISFFAADAFPGLDDRNVLRVRRDHIVPVGLRAAAIARRLRRACGFYRSPLGLNDWSAVRVMQKARKRAVRESIRDSREANMPDLQP